MRCSSLRSRNPPPLSIYAQAVGAFKTTHNPLVLDGLDLTDDRIRLFATERDDLGHVTVNRILVSEDLIKTGQPLSRLWINGYLGGV